jgi:hypothetical protein
VVRFETVFPGGECATCLLDPLMDAVLYHDHITVMTLGDRQEKIIHYYALHGVISTNQSSKPSNRLITFS